MATASLWLVAAGLPVTSAIHSAIATSSTFQELQDRLDDDGEAASLGKELRSLCQLSIQPVPWDAVRISQYFAICIFVAQAVAVQ